MIAEKEGILLKTALQGKGRSAGYARDRMKMLLVSERIDCSPQMMKMLKNDMIHTVKNILQLTRRKLRSASLRNLLFSCGHSCQVKKEQRTK